MKILDLLRGEKHAHADIVHHNAKVAAQKFDDDEIHVLKMTWEDLADRSNGKGIDKDTFLQYFPLHGLLGERLFAQFDTRRSGFIGFEEFITGLATACRGTVDDKIHFVFNMYDVSHDNTVSKQELTTLLNHVPKEAFNSTPTPGAPISRINSGAGIATLGVSLQPDITEDFVSMDAADTTGMEYDELDAYTNQELVERAFAECDLNHEGRLTYEEFKMWILRNPSILDYIESILPYNGPKDALPHSHKKESLPHVKRIASKASVARKDSIQEVAGEIFNHSTHLGNRKSSRRSLVLSTNGGGGETGPSTPLPTSPLGMPISNHTSFGNGLPPPLPNLRGSTAGSAAMGLSLAGDSAAEPEEQVRYLLQQAVELSPYSDLRISIQQLIDSIDSGIFNGSSQDATGEVYRKVVSMEDFLWKKGKSMFHMIGKRYYLLAGNCVYYYSHKNDVRPKGVIFLTGSIIERIKDDEMELKGFFGYEITHQDLCTNVHHYHDKRILYARSEEDREKWVSALQHAAHVVPIEDDYVIGKELGRGRFSVVCECVHKGTGQHCAVKIIDKATIEPEEKSLLRTEIAVLKLVNHPNIIRLEGLYESKNYLYIVMEMLKGGELFERIVGRPRFSELEAAKLMKPLLESVAYLHDLGIVHRDLKPENILCGEELDDLKIADFGLSKMILPKEKMDAACGTLSYVAPEVLTMQGYGKEADLWSVGVILFLILCGKLPFDGEDHNEIIRSTIQADLKVNANVWNKLSDDAKGLICALLNKNPKCVLFSYTIYFILFLIE
jgi:Ca2+-binding EF-hand superfamily protein/predicted Ser/Thr protein kinase